MLKNKCQNFWLLILSTLASSEFWLLDLATRQVVKPQSQVHPKAFATHSQLTCDLQKFSRLISRLASRKTPKNSFLKCFSWETCFKPLPSSLKPAFQYFYIKTQSIWMVFHSTNSFKVILNSFAIFLATRSGYSREYRVLATCFGDPPSREFIQKLSWLTSHETSKNSFLKCFSWETCFKPLSSSLKPLFQYFYIKTQSIWMVFHSINISKVILNSFHWFGSLDYVLETFVLLVGIFIIRVGKLNFCQFFVWDWFLLMICFGCWPIIGKKNMY